MIVAPSLLAADFNHLAEEVKKVEELGVQWLHLDIMDGHFVPNISFGPDVIKALRPNSKLVFDVHLMIEKVETYFQKYIDAGADYLTFHFEATKDIASLIKKIKATGTKVGISLKPATPASVLKPYLKDLDLILVMTVEPGFGGQSFMSDMVPKIKELKDLKEQNNYNYLISVDGGINGDTSKIVSETGADVVVAGTYLFKSPDIKERIEALLEL
ncbi:MAG: ribulose-phosphate 3-epimerase [Bacilli bacterium]|jgi:ribulose-phosphate 3-epimerase|nr:ribulose-phosphate 3-epimerase [Acholeplasmataceae bacterium]